MAATIMAGAYVQDDEIEDFTEIDTPDIPGQN
jgi:hypothetical protein